MSKLNGGIIGPDNVPTGAFGSASGVWSLSDVTNYKKQGTWPIVLTGHQVANSCRFDTNAGMNKTAANGTRTKATFSAWVKRSVLGDESLLFNSRIDASNHFLIRFTGGDALELVNRISASNISFYTTNQLFRDVSAWYHVVWSIDTTQASSGDRIKLFVNGTQVTSFATSTTQSQSTDLAANINTAEYYVAQEYTSGDNYFDGYMAEVVWIDGTAYAASYFGETDSVTNNWVPKDVSGLTFGNSGFYLDFKDSSNLGNDANGGTDLTENNITSIDQSIDSCTNNFATLNPLDRSTLSSDGTTFTEGNLKTTDASSNYLVATGTLAVTQGKWYFEVKIDATASNTASGVAIVDLDGWNRTDGSANTAYGWLYAPDGDKRNNSTSTSYGNTYSANDIIGVAIDMDNKSVYFSKNGTFQNNGDPTSGASKTNAAFTNLTGTITAQVYDGSSGQAHEFSMNFGSAPYAISSGNVDSSGMGNFEYAVPEGYYSLCTRNLNLIG